MDKIKISDLAKLSFINLTGDETAEFTHQLKEIVESIEATLDRIDLSRVQDGDYYKKSINIMRDDKPESRYLREMMLLNAKTVKDGYILVPKLIKEEN